MLQQQHAEYTKVRWLWTVVGLLLYVVDIGTDVYVAVRYFRDDHLVWSGLTLLFVLAGVLGTQTFSYCWYLDDMNNVMINPDGRRTVSGMSRAGLTGLHLFGMGIFTRYYHLLKTGFHVVWSKPSVGAVEDRRVHQSLFVLATDLSMLKLMEGFLESTPQLLLQLYIMASSEEIHTLQYACAAFSLLNAACSLVDYRRCLRRSLAHVREMPSGLPTVVYLVYKLLTITARLLGYCLLLLLSVYSTVALAGLWLLATTWAHLLGTDFCSRAAVEWLYRAVVGVILTFTFFNVKGQNAKAAMSVYYLFHSLVVFSAPVLLAWLRPEARTAWYLLPVAVAIFVGTVLGLVCLVVYYALLHPRERPRQADEVDGLGGGGGEGVPEMTPRMRNFLQP